MKWLQLFEEFKKKKYKYHSLSGIALIVDGKILLVHPRKYKKEKDKWSIPKGHIEGENSLKSALKELEEESGIKLKGKDHKEMFTIDYKKSGVFKFMDVYVYHLDKSDIKKYLGDNWEIKKKWYDKKEIFKCKFFDLDEARKKIEIGMMDIIDHFQLKK